MKDILLINDMPGYGRVALSCMIPVLSNKGKSVFNLPTAVVSNTLDYGKFAILDTTEYMKQATKVWEELDFSFDLIATGFLYSGHNQRFYRKTKKLTRCYCGSYYGRQWQTVQWIGRR